MSKYIFKSLLNTDKLKTMNDCRQNMKKMHKKKNITLNENDEQTNKQRFHTKVRQVTTRAFTYT